MGSKPASRELTKALLTLLKQFCEAHVIHDSAIVNNEIENQEEIIPRILKRVKEAGLALNKKMYFCKAGDTGLSSSRIKTWSKT